MTNVSKILLRKADFSDIEFLFYLRNQPATFQYAKNNRPVQWEEHIDWIMPIILGITNKNLFVIEYYGVKAGQTRVDTEGQEAEVHISLLKEFRGKGLASEAIKMEMDKVEKEKKIKVFKAEIHQDNIASQKLFEKLGFKFINQGDVWKRYVLKT